MSRYETDLAVETLRPGEEGYDATVRGFFGNGRPALVVLPRHPDEIAAALRHALRDNLTVSVRSGGHSPLGRSAERDAMVIDLRHLDSVEVLDAHRRIVRVGAGATWGKVGATLDGYGLAVSAGDTRSVGVSGLTLGGGIGWMVRRSGLTIDNLIGARVVTADGRLLATSNDEHADLFWALRGGGGNFGIVVDFDFIAQHVERVHFGTVNYELDDPASLMARWRDAMRVAPDNLSSTLALPPQRPDAPATAIVLLCYTDEPGATNAEADAAIEPLLELGAVTAATITECPYSEILEDAQRPSHVQVVTRNALVPTLDDAVIAATTRLQGGSAPTAVALRSLGGAFGRVPADSTAFAHRDVEAMIVVLLMLPEAATEAEVDTALAPWKAVAGRGVGSYVNFQGSATPSDLTAAYPPATLARLSDVKRRYDPDNRFALNHNIDPRSRHRHAQA